MPSAFGPDRTLPELVGIREGRIRCQDSIDYAASSLVPLPTSVSHARIREAKAFFRSAPFMGELDEELVDPTPLLEEGNGAIRLD
jgi:hypothetical protein